MSRFVLSCLLALTTTTAALATPQFARPPGALESRGAVAIETGGAEAPVSTTPIVLDRAAVRAKLVANRRANLERFRAYVRRGVFPNNTYSSGLLNVWLDETGHLCAAATIIEASGAGDLVAKVARENNFIRLADVTDGALMDWMLTSGFTQAELVAIQKPFGGVGRPVRPVNPGITDSIENPPVVIDSDKRATETARLAKLYRRVDAMIVGNERASLDLAVDRLMARPAIAARLLAR